MNYTQTTLDGLERLKTLGCTVLETEETFGASDLGETILYGYLIVFVVFFALLLASAFRDSFCAMVIMGTLPTILLIVLSLLLNASWFEVYEGTLYTIEIPDEKQSISEIYEHFEPSSKQAPYMNAGVIFLPAEGEKEK